MLRDKFGIGERLRQLRGSLSQKAFAQKIEISLRAYQWYETGGRIPPDIVLEKIATTCNVDMAWLTKGVADLQARIDKVWEQESADFLDPEIMARRLVKHISKYPNLFVELVNVLEEGNYVKIDAVRAQLRAINPTSTRSSKKH